MGSEALLARAERDTLIVQRRRAGASLDVIGQQFRLSKGRVCEILANYLSIEERSAISQKCWSRAQGERAAALRARLLADLPPCGCPQCCNLECEAKPGCCHSCGDPVRPARQTEARRRTVVGYPYTYCERCHPSQHVKRRQAQLVRLSLANKTQRELAAELVALGSSATQSTVSYDLASLATEGTIEPWPARENHARVMRVVNAAKTARVPAALGEPGGCGSRTCGDPACTVPHGRCHCPGCNAPALIASRSGVSCRWVIGEPTLYCAAHGKPWRLHADLNRALEEMGLVARAKTAKLTCRAPRAVFRAIPTERITVGRFVRLGANAREVYGAAPGKHDARSKLAKPLAVLNRTPRVGGPLALSSAELEIVISFRSADPATWSWRKLQQHVNAGRGADRPAVSHMAVKRAFERRSATTLAL